MKQALKKVSVFAFVLTLVAVLVGCNNSNSIVGTWKYGSSDDIYYTFNKNNTGSYTYSGSTKNFTYEDRGTKVIITYEGNTASSEFDYSISDGKLTIKDSSGNDVIYERK